MSEPRIDPERLAALLDGKLDERARELLLAELAESEEDRLALGDAAAVLRELEAELGTDVSPDVPLELPPAASLGEPVPIAPLAPSVTGGASSRPEAGGERPGAVVGEISPRPVPPWRVPRWVGGVAAAAVVLVAAGLWSRSRGAGGDVAALGDPHAVLALVETPAAARGDALPAVPWPVTRGAEEPLTARARAVQYGARAVELDLAAAAGDSAAVADVARRAARLIGDFPGSSPVVGMYRAVSEHPGAGAAALAPELREAWRSGLGLFADSADAWAGAWLGAARAAAARRDAAFFGKVPSRRMLDALAARQDVDAETRAAAGRVRDAVGTPAPDWGAVGRDVTLVLTALGS